MTLLSRPGAPDHGMPVSGSGLVVPLTRAGRNPHIYARGRRRLHQGTRIGAESLPPWHERITVVQVLHLTLFHVIGEPYVMMRPHHQAGVFAFEPLAKGRNLFGRASSSQTNGQGRTRSACRYPRISVHRSTAGSRPGLCAGTRQRDGRSFAGQPWKSSASGGKTPRSRRSPGGMSVVPLGCFKCGPCDCAHFGHCRKSIIHSLMSRWIPTDSSTSSRC